MSNIYADDDGGSALVVHEDADEHVTRPIGGADGRIACTVIERRPRATPWDTGCACADTVA